MSTSGLTSRSHAASAAGRREVLALVAQGLSSREIAERLHISERTERTHVIALHSKLHTQNRVQLALHYLRQEAQG